MKYYELNTVFSKHCFLVFFLFVLSFDLAGQDPFTPIGIEPEKTLAPPVRDDCVRINDPGANEFYHDCDQVEDIKIIVDIFDLSDCFVVPLFNKCVLTVEVSLNNSVILSQPAFNQSSPIITIPGSTIKSAIDQIFDLPNIQESLCFSIVVKADCEGVIYNSTEIFGSTDVCYSVLSADEDFPDVISKEITLNDFIDGECLNDPKYKVCCNYPEGKSITYDLIYSNSNGTTETVKIGSWFNNMSLSMGPVKIVNPYNEATTITNSNSSGGTTTITKGPLDLPVEPGICYSINLRKITEKKVLRQFEVGPCGDNTHLSEIPDEIITPEQVVNICLNKCELLNNVTECDELPNIVLRESFKQEQNRNECTGSITADLDGADPTLLMFLWTGPDGFISDVQNLESVPFGTYSLVVSDECCKTSDEYTYDLVCGDLEVGPWVVENDDFQLFCRNRTCPITECTLTDECVEPDEILEVLENGFCTEKYLFESEFLGQVISDPELKIEYNPNTKECIRIGKCKMDEYIIDQESPTYGNLWNFNLATEKCERPIFCFDEQVPDVVDIKDPIIEETYNNLTGQCDRVAYCDLGVPNQLNPKSPLINGPWQWNQVQGCTKFVQCSTESGNEIVAGTESFNNWSYNPDLNVCLSNVSCDGTPISGTLFSDFPTSIGVWQYNTVVPNKCHRTIICGGTNLVSQVLDPTFNTTNLPCPGFPEFDLAYVICDGYNTFSTVCISGLEGEGDAEIRSFRSSKKGVIISPNPLTDYVSIEGLDFSKDYRVSIFSPTNQLVYSASLQSQRLELDHLPRGLYIIKILEDNQLIHIDKIIKN